MLVGPGFPYSPFPYLHVVSTTLEIFGPARWRLEVDIYSLNTLKKILETCSATAREDLRTDLITSFWTRCAVTVKSLLSFRGILHQKAKDHY